MHRPLLLTTVGACVMLTAAGIACAQEPSADDLVGLMVKANQGWLMPSIEALSYRLKVAPLPGDPPGNARGNARGNADSAVPSLLGHEEAVTVYYRAPRHLRAESDRGEILLLPDGRGYRFAREVRQEEWSADRALRYLCGIGYLGAAWELANNREDWELEQPTSEAVDGRDCIRLHGKRKTEPAEPDRQISVQEWYRYDGFDLWLDAETHRPVRESLARGEYLVWWARYLDYRPLPEGGEAPMRIEVYSGSIDAYLPGAAARGVYDYALVGGRVWFLHGWHTLLWSATVTDLSTDPVSITVFYDERMLNSLARGEELERDLNAIRQTQRWPELMKTCIEITQVVPRHQKANDLLRTLYFWHGDYEKSIEAALMTGIGERQPGDLYLAWAYDAVGKRDEAVKTYREVIDRHPSDEVLAAAKAGLERPWVSIARRLRPQPGEVMAQKGRGWRARASHNEDAAALAIDGDRQSRWVSLEVQSPGMWLSVDLGKKMTARRILFDHVGELTMYYRDYPRRYVVEASVDGETWRQVAEGAGSPDGLVEARFEPQAMRHVRIRQEGRARRYHWSVYEVYVYAVEE